jgi:dihydropyrimidine dehydrogenase (NAD+) subunit PreA
LLPADEKWRMRVISMGGAVQLATVVMFNGYLLVEQLLSGILDFMDRHGFETIADFQGLGLKRIKHKESEL